MGFFSQRRIHKSVAEHGVVDVSEKAGVRSLHLGSSTIQSSMRVSAPNKLELNYTRSMMAFLLFHPAPRDFLMIGLGGGSLVKYVYHYLPQSHTTAIEINPQVVAVARTHFCLPEDDERLSVLVEEGGQYVATHPGASDVLICDGFDGQALSEPLTTALFFVDCRRALRDNGIFVINLWGSDPRFPTYLERVNEAFDNRTLCLPTEKHGNILVFGFVREQGSPTWDTLRERARRLEVDHDLEFLRFVERLGELNPRTDKRLLI